MSDIIAVNRRLDALEGLLERLRKADAVLYGASAAGAYLPTYLGASSPGVTTYTTQVGSWTQVGRIAIVTGQVVWTAATGTGAVRVGLPGNLVPAIDGIGAVYTNNVTFANGSIQGIIQQPNGYIRLFSPITDGGSTELTIEAAGEIRFIAIYSV